MDPQPSSSRRPVFATRSPPGYHSGGMPKFQAHVVAAPPHCRNSIQDAHPKKTERKNGLRRIKGLDVIQVSQIPPHSKPKKRLSICLAWMINIYIPTYLLFKKIASTNPVLRCRLLESRVSFFFK